MNGVRPTVNGEHTFNGIHQSSAATSSGTIPSKARSVAQTIPAPPPQPVAQSRNVTNGSSASSQQNGVIAQSEADHAPQEILNLIPRESYLPVATLISRTSQACWNGLSEVVETLATIPIPELPPDQARIGTDGQPNNQSKQNLDKKERILQYARIQKKDFIKLLVILQWSKNEEDVNKTISIYSWLSARRKAYIDAQQAFAILKQDASNFQIPNPDLKTAAEVLSRGSVDEFPRFGYTPQSDLTSKQVLRVLRSLNQVLGVKLALLDGLPAFLRKFHIQDGRATFMVESEFELDVSVMGETEEHPFRMVDLRFAFRPSPAITDRQHSEIEFLTNENIDKNGLQGAYEFLHELTLSYKLAEIRKQALALSRGQWAGHLRVELLRRTLVIQYWIEKQTAKSWLEIGVVSGKNSGAQISMLELKWVRQGKRIELAHMNFNQAVLSLEDLLRQVVAQDTTSILNVIYDKLQASPLFAEHDLSLEQSISYDDPSDCSLIVQTSQPTQIQLKVDAVTGQIMVSPVTERTERLQRDINRAQASADDVASKLLEYRCSVVESIIQSSLAGSRLQALPAFRLSSAESKALFKRLVVWANMYRSSEWTQDYILAITHSVNGDHWWLLQQGTVSASSSETHFKVLRDQTIAVTDDLSSSFFSRLVDYLTGLIFVQRNTDYLESQRRSFETRRLSTFGKDSEMPEVVFSLDLAKPQTSAAFVSIEPAQTAAKTPAVISTKDTDTTLDITITFGGANLTSSTVTSIAKYETKANSKVLSRFDKLMLHPDVSIDSAARVVTIRAQTPMADTAVPVITRRASHLERLIATVQQIQRLPGLQLKSMTDSKITITYCEEAPTELGLSMDFQDEEEPPRLEFYPTQSNPHQLLAPAFNKLLASPRASFAVLVCELLTSLDLTLPVVTYLRHLQRRLGLGEIGTEQWFGPRQDSEIRVHILPRSTTDFAVQYFANADHLPTNIEDKTQSKILCRTEILHELRNGKPMWVVRAAIEEFASYSRASYASDELREILRKEIFSRRPDGIGNWIALDKAAACLVDKPEPLLQAILDVLQQFVRKAKSPQKTAGSVQDSAKSTSAQKASNAQRPSLSNGTAKPMPAQTKGLSGKAQVPPGLMNGANNKFQRPPMNAQGGRPGNTKSNAANKNDVITIED
jgi:mediator of RNA polymerase II transcription subunit 14